MSTKNKFLNKKFFLLVTVGANTTVFIDNKLIKSHKPVEIEGFPQFFSLLLEGAGAGSGSTQIFTDLNPDPGGPKTAEQFLLKYIQFTEQFVHVVATILFCRKQSPGGGYFHLAQPSSQGLSRQVQ
jgi:hypothetical protein